MWMSISCGHLRRDCFALGDGTVTDIDTFGVNRAIGHMQHALGSAPCDLV